MTEKKVLTTRGTLDFYYNTVEDEEEDILFLLAVS